MKFALIGVSLLAAGASALAWYAVRSIGDAAWSGYCLGWTEASRGQQMSAVGFSDRLAVIQKAEAKAKAIHQRWHAENPGKSCAEMLDGRKS